MIFSAAARASACAASSRLSNNANKSSSHSFMSRLPQTREEMRELLAAKANVDRLLNMETEHDTEREKGHEQR